MNRRDFLRAVVGASGLIAVLPAGCELESDNPKSSSTKKTEGVLVNDIHTELNPTIVDRTVYPNSIYAIQETIRSAGKKGKGICIAAARHAMGAQQFASRGILIDTTALSRVLNFNQEEGAIEVEAGIQWPLVIGYLLNEQKGQSKQWGIAQKQSADWLSIGGSLASNIHGQGIGMKPFIQDVESFVLIDANGKEVKCSRRENTELFRLALGGYGLFGVIYSVNLRLVPRKKVERVAEIMGVEDLMGTYEKRIREGFLYGAFLYNPNPESDDFLRKGILVCYRPVESDAQVPDYHEQPSNEKWLNLRYLAHADKEQYFEKIKGQYLGSSGQVYWSDTHQTGFYLKGYHHQLDKKLGGAAGSDIPTEVFIPRGLLEDFLDLAREDFRKNRVDLIFGEIGVIQEDDESFLSYARRSCARVSFHIHTPHNPDGVERSRRATRRLIDMAIKLEGSYYLTNHKFTTPEQLRACYPQFSEFIRLKKKYDPEDIFQSDWYRYYRDV